VVRKSSDKKRNCLDVSQRCFPSNGSTTTQFNLFIFHAKLKVPREMKNGYYFVPNSVLIEIESFFLCSHLCAFYSFPDISKYQKRFIFCSPTQQAMKNFSYLLPFLRTKKEENEINAMRKIFSPIDIITFMYRDSLNVYITLQRDFCKS